MSDNNNTGHPTAPEINTTNGACNGTQATQSSEPYECDSKVYKHVTAPRAVQKKRWENIPAELKAIPNWCLADANKAPCLVNDTGQLYHVSPVQGPWYTFEDAERLATALQTPIGIIVPEGYTCIDCDIKDKDSKDKHGEDLALELFTPNSEMDHFAELVSYADTYAELSNSKKGLHLWVKGDIGDGVRSGHMEVYSRDRFIISTGNAVSELVYTNLIGVVVPFVIATQVKPIAERQSLIEMLTRGIDTKKVTQIDLEELPEVHTDTQILTIARGAHNADKFNALYAGNWETMGFPSQSEADLALLSMFTFYSPSNAQVRRLFRRSELGMRDKAVKNDVYLNRSIRTIRSREAAEEHAKVEIDIQSLHATKKAREETQRKIKEENNNPLYIPEGFAGELINYVQGQARLPVLEVATVAILGLLAGICGKAWSTPTNAGLNLYVLLVARSGIGKDAMHTGINSLSDAVESTTNNKDASNFVLNMTMASAPALVKELIKKDSAVWVQSEMGHLLTSLMSNNANINNKMLLAKMTELYSQSGLAGKSNGIAYSVNDKNVDSFNAAFSLVGETTPSTFNTSITDASLEDGFLSRMLVIEYSGDRGDPNKNPVNLSPELVRRLSHLITVATQQQRQTPYQKVIYSNTDESELTMDAFDLECSNNIRANLDEGVRSIWNRAHMKALKIACLLAVTDNPENPSISIHHAKFAINLVRRSNNMFLQKLESGDIGDGDDVREKKVIDIIKKALAGQLAMENKYSEIGVVPRRIIISNTNKAPTFKNHPLKQSKAVDLTLKSLIDSGHIVELKKEENIGGGRYFKLL